MGLTFAHGGREGIVVKLHIVNPEDIYKELVRVVVSRADGGVRCGMNRYV